MVYGDTVSYGRDRERNLAVLERSVTVDIATQLHRPTGHAINPVPLTEAERIPDAAEILEVHLIARELEREVRRSAPRCSTGRWVERRAAEAATYARAFRDEVLRAWLGRRRRATPPSCCSRCAASRPPSSSSASAVPAPRELRALETWKHGVVAQRRGARPRHAARGSTACASCSPRSRSTTSSATRSPASSRAPARR